MGDLAEGMTAEWWSFSDAELLSVMGKLEKRKRRIESRMLGVVGEIVRRGLGSELGYGSVAVLQRELLNVSLGEGRRRVTLAGAVDGSPAGAALAAGLISAEHVDVIERFRTSLSESVHPDEWARAEPVLVELSASCDPRGVARFADRELRARIDPDGACPSERALAQPRNELDLRFGPDGWLELRGKLEPESGALLAAQLGPLACPRPADADGRDVRTTGRRQGDALAEWVRLGHAGLPMPAEGGERPQLTVTVAWETLRDGLGTATLGTLGTDQLPISVSEARRLACDAQIIPMVLGTGSLPLDVGRASRTIPPHIRRAVVKRDGGCTFPGCDKPGPWCQVHHVREWADGGPTALGNLALLCPAHHRLVHHSGWDIRMRYGRPEFLPPPYLDPFRKPRTNPLRQSDAT